MHTHTHIYIYTYIPSNDPGSAADEPRRRGAFGGARPDAGDVTWQPAERPLAAAARGRAMWVMWGVPWTNGILRDING